jgi:hypothetical protein
MAQYMTAPAISLTKDQRAEIEVLRQRTTVAAGLANRAKAILLLADGTSFSEPLGWHATPTSLQTEGAFSPARCCRVTQCKTAWPTPRVVLAASLDVWQTCC